MQYVRCEACGAKALLAASRCPKCAHPLELRDHHGEFVPLSHCRKCDTWYPTSRGGCKWCGTKPSSEWPARPAVFVGIGALLVVGAWWALSRRVPATESPAQAAAPAPPPVAEVTVAPRIPVAADTLVAGDTIRPMIDTAVAPTVEPRLLAPTPAVAPPVQGAQAPTAFVRTGWATPDTYINLRDGADRTASIIGTINPGVRVETGARFRGWRQVRTPAGQVGWVDPRHLQESAAPPPR